MHFGYLVGDINILFFGTLKLTSFSEHSTDADVTLAVVSFVPEAETHAAKTTASLARLLDPLSACSGAPYDSLSLRTKDRLYDAAKVFLQIHTHRKRMDKKDTSFQELSMYAETIPACPRGDADLYSVLTMVRQVVKGRGDAWMSPKFMPGFSFPHLIWMSHHLVHRVWEFCENDIKVPDGVYEFFSEALAHSTTEKAGINSLEPILSNFLLAISLTVGLRVESTNLLNMDKRYKFISSTSFARISPSNSQRRT